MPVQYIIRNYNRFLVTRGGRVEWEDFYIHRHPSDAKKLLKFDSPREAEQFIEAHPDLEKEWDAWVVPFEHDCWQGLAPFGRN